VSVGKVMVKMWSLNSYSTLFGFRTPFGLPCELQTPVASPELNGYRTKCEFTIGTNLEGERTVGFLLGMFKQGQTAVQEPSQCLHVSDVAKKVAAAMEVSYRASSESYTMYMDSPGRLLTSTCS
jgi:tRNA/tmRNA/rRNA uracil-C5-methylase (TrmA/RlmC/RlmD family)